MPAPTRRPAPHKKQQQNNRTHAARRIEKRGGGDAPGAQPKSVLDVYDFVGATAEPAASGSGSARERRRGKADARLRRATTNNAADDDADVRNPRAAAAGDSDADSDDVQDELTRRTRAAPAFLDVADDVENVVNDEDDEELDSDEAWGESDEEKFASSMPKVRGGCGAASPRGAHASMQSQRLAKGRKDASGDDEEDEEEDEDDEGDADMLDLSRMLDAGSQSDEEDGSASDASDDSGDERLQQHMSSLAAQPSKRSARSGDADEGSDGEPSAKRTRRVLAARSEAVPESQFGVGGASGSRLRVEDLMSTLDDSGAGASFNSLRQSARALARAEQARGAGGAASRRGGGALQAPLPAVVQDRLDRAAAYDASRNEVAGWAPTIKRLREAEHLSFPLQPEHVPQATTAALTSSFRAENDMERGVAALLAQEGMSEKEIAKAEELEMNRRGMDEAEVRKRREELRRMRDLLFREEQKAKRVKKIKSKTYRKIARRERDKEDAQAKAAGLGDSEDEAEEREKDARLRAKERATLKHKNTGKWAKGIVGHHATMENVEARNAIEEQLQQGERLRRRIQGQASDDESDSEEDSDEEAGASDPRRQAFDELAALQARDAAAQEAEADMQGGRQTSGKKGGVWAMKFMADARKRDAATTQEEIDAFRAELASEEEGSTDDEERAEKELLARRTNVQGNAGRAVFGTSGVQTAKKAEQKAEHVPREDDSEEDESEASEAEASKSAPAPAPAPVTAAPAAAAAPSATSDAYSGNANPWLANAGEGTKLSRKRNDAIVAKESSAATRAANRTARHAAKGDEARGKAEDDARVEIDPNARLAVTTGRKGKQAAPRAGAEETDSDSDAEPVAVGRGLAAMKQRALVAEAFAGDDVAADFAAEKRAAVEREAPREEDTTLAGWGSWGGKGVKSSGASRRRDAERRKRNTRTIAGLAPEARKDAKMEHVIINERKDKKADKYRAKDVPYPYTSAAQYEMAMRNPVGKEWNTVTQHQRLTLPRVVTKPGKAILPIGEWCCWATRRCTCLTDRAADRAQILDSLTALTIPYLLALIVTVVTLVREEDAQRELEGQCLVRDGDLVAVLQQLAERANEVALCRLAQLRRCLEEERPAGTRETRPLQLHIGTLGEQLEDVRQRRAARKRHVARIAAAHGTVGPPLVLERVRVDAVAARVHHVVVQRRRARRGQLERLLRACR
jgi:U3 small nucleolar RNA-associated protein 14